MKFPKPLWIARDSMKCSGCRKCEIACSLFHEKRIWPEASRIRVFMLVPGAEVPHLCAQCEDYPCVNSCPQGALSVNLETEAVRVDEQKCTGCGVCIDACPGRVPHLHPVKKTVLICDLCNGEPQCVKVCQDGGWCALEAFRKSGWGPVYKVFSRKPEDVTKDVVQNIYGEKGEDYI